jgi:hypothetical protein
MTTNKMVVTGLVIFCGVLVLVAPCLPWVWVGPLYLRGYQGDGLAFLAAGLLSILSALTFIWKRQRRRYAALALAGGLLAAAASLASFVSLAFRAFLDMTTVTVQTAATANDLVGGTSLAAVGSLTLPGELFVIGLFHQPQISAFFEGLEQTSDAAQTLLTTLNDMALVPRAGAGLILSLAVGVFLSGLGCYLLSFQAARKKQPPAFRPSQP